MLPFTEQNHDELKCLKDGNLVFKLDEEPFDSPNVFSPPYGPESVGQK